MYHVKLLIYELSLEEENEQKDPWGLFIHF